jgi:hypothetical protein
MKKFAVIAMMVALLMGAQPAHAGIIHRLAKITTAPFWVAGWMTACVGGFIGIPFENGAYYFCSQPFVSW